MRNFRHTLVFQDWIWAPLLFHAPQWLAVVLNTLYSLMAGCWSLILTNLTFQHSLFSFHFLNRSWKKMHKYVFFITAVLGHCNMTSWSADYILHSKPHSFIAGCWVNTSYMNSFWWIWVFTNCGMACCWDSKSNIDWFDFQVYTVAYFHEIVSLWDEKKPSELNFCHRRSEPLQHDS